MLDQKARQAVVDEVDLYADLQRAEMALASSADLVEIVSVLEPKTLPGLGVGAAGLRNGNVQEQGVAGLGRDAGCLADRDARAAGAVQGEVSQR